MSLLSLNHLTISETSKSFSKKHSNFISECYDYLRDIVPFDGEKIFVSGGFFPRRFIGAPLRDVDVYVNGDDQYLAEVIEDYRQLDWKVNHTLEKAYDGEGEGNTKRVLHYICSKDGEPNIDLIAFHEPKSVFHIEKFDLNIVQLAISDDCFHFVNDDIFEYFETKHMNFTGNICTRTFERIIKYTILGYLMELEELAHVRNSFIEKIERPWRDAITKEKDTIPII